MTVRLFLCGDVMTGRGIDQVLAHPSDPELREPSITDAREYVGLAERVNGAVPRPVTPRYPWGDALAELERARPDARIINLETSITKSDAFFPAKEVHYRMHPDNVGCLSALGLDCAVLANNHVMDFGRDGLHETLATLRSAHITAVGAGRDRDEARRPAPLATPAGRVLVVACCAESSGVPSRWAAERGRPGVFLLRDLSEITLRQVLAVIEREREPGDVVVVSIHWGSNWGFAVPAAHVRFARGLLDAGVHVVHGHSSHHVRPIEFWRRGLVLYGAGDFLTDYEGISGYELFRDDLTLMYFVDVDPDAGVVGLDMVPLQLHRFSLRHASRTDALWLLDTLRRESAGYGLSIEIGEDRRLHARAGLR